jgi:hypothetical protein
MGHDTHSSALVQPLLHKGSWHSCVAHLLDLVHIQQHVKPAEQEVEEQDDILSRDVLTAPSYEAVTWKQQGLTTSKQCNRWL